MCKTWILCVSVELIKLIGMFDIKIPKETEHKPECQYIDFTVQYDFQRDFFNNCIKWLLYSPALKESALEANI